MQDEVQRIQTLRQQLEYHNHKYYVEDSPEIDDFEYDKMMQELIRLEEAHPELITPDSPTQRVGGKAEDLFSPVVHTVPMESLQYVYCEVEMMLFYHRVS